MCINCNIRTTRSPFLLFFRHSLHKGFVKLETRAFSPHTCTSFLQSARFRRVRRGLYPCMFFFVHMEGSSNRVTENDAPKFDAQQQLHRKLLLLLLHKKVRTYTRLLILLLLQSLPCVFSQMSYHTRVCQPRPARTYSGACSASILFRILSEAPEG